MSEPAHTERIGKFSQDTQFNRLSGENRAFLERKAEEWRLTHQEIRKLILCATDFEMWGQGGLSNAWDETGLESMAGKNRGKVVLGRVEKRWNELKEASPAYAGRERTQPMSKAAASDGVTEALTARPKISRKQTAGKILGNCPVASDKTRCCGLKTLDAVMNCGYDCSYCSIQSFYYDNNIYFHEDFRAKLQEIRLDPNELYHIGTGQSSDSLLWGNRYDVLGDLFEFASNNPNVILEFKTKSANVRYLLENPAPENLIVTWSLNPQLIVENEELGTASLEARLEAAEKVAAKGILVGFHFHPMIIYQGWKGEYARLFAEVQGRFTPEQVALVSFGTLTYIKPVMKQLRLRKHSSKILQMPMESAAGKFSYPMAVKEEMFKLAYDAFADWHEKVFFYLCMEPAELWPSTFGFDYPDNQAFETAMKTRYMEKIAANRRK